MPKGKGLKLRDALDRHKDVDRRAEHQKKIQKQAEKRKRSRAENEEEDEILQDAVADAAEELEGKSGNASKRKRLSPAEGEDEDEDEAGEDWETDSDEEEAGYDLSRLDDSEDDTDSDDDINVAQQQKVTKKTINGDAEEDEDEDEDDEEDEDIPLSDIESLASEDKGDVIPHQRLTINNHAALLRAHKSIALPTNLPWVATQSITSEEPTVIADIDDDLGRELAFYKQSLDAVKKARAMLQASKIPMSRPADYFAEMVKTDEHMGKIKKKLVDEAAGKKAAADARRQRDLRKFGKQVQVAKLQERDKAKKETMEKISMLKRKRQGADISNENEEDMFDVALEDAAVTERKDKAARREKGPGGKPNFKRQKRDEKYGHGGKKRFSKSNDAKSSADTSSYSVKKMKGKKPQRPGKSKRARN
ncbi:hypothetical protein MBLNU457_5872t1 [Dothideomycetes sp. NU457]